MRLALTRLALLLCPLSMLPVARWFPRRRTSTIALFGLWLTSWLGACAAPVSSGDARSDVADLGRPTDAAALADLASDGPAPACIGWTGLRTFGASRDDEARSVLIDPSGRTWVAGYANGTQGSVVPEGSARAVLLRIEPDGAEQSSAPLGLVSPTSIDLVRLDSAGALWGIGRTREPFAGPPVPSGRYDVVAGRIVAGAMEPTYRTGVIADDLPVAAAIDDQALVIGGYAEVYAPAGAVESWEDGFVARLGPGQSARVDAHSVISDYVFAVDARDGRIAVSTTRGAGQDRGVHVRLLDAQLEPLWTTRISAAPFDAAYGLRIEPSGDVTIVGGIVGPRGDQDVLIGRLARDNGALTILARWGGADAEMPTAIATAPDGTLLVVGDSLGGIQTPRPTGFGIFAAGLGPDGKPLWIHEADTPRDDHAAAIASDACGRIVIVGYTAGSLEGEVARGGRDGFVWAFDPPRRE